MKIVLIGYMGSGKSRVGKMLSEKLQYLFKDLDEVVESSEENTIQDIFSLKGEIYFRKKEASILDNLLKLDEDIVLATGGGTPCYGTTMTDLNALEEVITIYLKTSLDTLTQRLFVEKNNRPLISHLQTTEELNDFIRKHLFERSYFYNQATMVIDTENAEAEDVVERIVLQLF